MERLQHWEAKHLALAGPFGRQIGETRNSHAVREPSNSVHDLNFRTDGACCILNVF